MLTWQVAYAPRPTRPNRPLRSGRRRPPWWRRCRSATHRPALRSIDRRSKSASDPRTLLAPPPIPAATPAASSALQCAEKRRGGARPAMDDEGSAGRASAGPVAPSARGTCRRPDDSRRATADGGAVGAAAAAPPVGGALVVAWAALRRRSGRPGSGGSLPPHHFEMPADHFEMPAPAARAPRDSFFYKAKFEPIEETEAGRLEALRDGRFPPSGRPDLRIARAEIKKQNARGEASTTHIM